MAEYELNLRIILTEAPTREKHDPKQYLIDYGEASVTPANAESRQHKLPALIGGSAAAAAVGETTATIRTTAPQMVAQVMVDTKLQPTIERLTAAGCTAGDAEELVAQFGSARVQEVLDWANRLALTQPIANRPGLIRSTLTRRARQTGRR